MTTRLNIALSEDLNAELDRVAQRNQTTKSEVFRKALQLYLEAQKAKQAGMKLGLVDADSNALKTEFIGL